MQMRHISTAAVLAAAWLAFSVLATGQTPRPSPAPRLAVAPAAAPYFPDRFEWQHKKPDDVGMDPLRLDDAVKFAIANENPANRDLNLTLATTFGRSEPFDTPIGPVKARGSRERPHHSVTATSSPNGVRPKSVDMTFSVTKTFLTTVVGLAWQRGPDSRRERYGSRLHAARRRICSMRRTTRRSPGSTCCDRRVIGRARSGESRIGRIARKGRHPPIGPTASCTSQARTTSTTTCA